MSKSGIPNGHFRMLVPTDEKALKDEPSSSIKVFLGGTHGGSDWRDQMINILNKKGIDYYDPVVECWNEEVQEREIKERQSCDFYLYVITPKMTEMYSIAEVIDVSNKQPSRTIFVYWGTDEDTEFTQPQLKSLDKVGRMVVDNGGYWCFSLQYAVDFMQESICTFSPAIRKPIPTTDLKIDFMNGSTLKLCGSDSADVIVGYDPGTIRETIADLFYKNLYENVEAYAINKRSNIDVRGRLYRIRTEFDCQEILFQSDSSKELRNGGLTSESLIEVLIHRLKFLSINKDPLRKGGKEIEYLSNALDELETQNKYRDKEIP